MSKNTKCKLVTKDEMFNKTGWHKNTFKVGDVVRHVGNKKTGLKSFLYALGDTAVVTGVPGTESYDQRGYFGGEYGFETDISWEVSSEWELVNKSGVRRVKKAVDKATNKISKKKIVKKVINKPSKNGNKKSTR